MAQYVVKVGCFGYMTVEANSPKEACRIADHRGSNGTAEIDWEDWQVLDAEENKEKKEGD